VFSIVICFVCMRKMENNQKELRVKFGIFFFFFLYIYIYFFFFWLSLPLNCEGLATP
jgi:hypothetical protein